MEVTVVGIEINKNKNGELSTTIHYKREFEDWKQNNAVAIEGECVESDWIREAINNVHVGDQVLLGFSKGFQGKAVLSSITVL